MTAPVAAWLRVVLVCSLVIGSRGFSIQEGGLLTQDLTLQKWSSPITVKGNVFVAKDVTLSIAPGVVMRFAPGVMLAVNGTLSAKVGVCGRYVDWNHVMKVIVLIVSQSRQVLSSDKSVSHLSTWT